MAVSADWYRDRKSIICYTFDGKWDWDELYSRREWVLQTMAASDEKISIIVDLRETRHVPPNVLIHLRSLVRTVPPNHSGKTIFVTPGVIVAIYHKVLRQLSPDMLKRHHVSFVSTLEEAEQLLNEANHA